MKKSELQELLNYITREVIREFMNIDPATKSIEKMSSGGDDKNVSSSEFDDVKQKNDQTHDINHQIDQNKMETDAAKVDADRNAAMLKQYNRFTKPNLLKQRDALKQQLQLLQRSKQI